MIKYRYFIAVVAAAFVLGASCASNSGASPASAGLNPPSSESLYQWTGDSSYVSPKNVAVDAASLSNQSAGLASDWYKDAAIYHVWVKSFSDYDGDGVGDFRGITAKLDYIRNDLGCDTLWLSPIFDCAGKGTDPSYNMHGYDTVDYYSVNDYFGNEGQLEELLAQAHKRGMKVIFDFVPNHTSSSNPWFLNSAKSEDGKNDWYLWSDAKLNWSPMGNASTWYYNSFRQSYYYGAFWSGMPDLNFRNYEVREEMKNVARYWLNKGFDGLRIDAVRYLIENPGANGTIDTEETHQFFQELQKDVLDKYAALGYPKFMLGEAWINNDRARLTKYYGEDGKKEFNMLFDFDFSGQVTTAVKFGNAAVFGEIQYWDDLMSSGKIDDIAWFLCNHDNLSSRPATVYPDAAQLRLATAIELLQPGTPIVYYANEIGQKDADGYGGQDVRLRFPFDWTLESSEAAKSDSLLSLHRALLQLRSEYPAIRRGSRVPVASSVPSVNACILTAGGKSILCVYNLAKTDVPAVTLTLAAALAGNGVSTLAGTAGCSVSGTTVTVTDLKASGFAVFLPGDASGKNRFPY